MIGKERCEIKDPRYRMAAALLIHYRELSLEEIEVLPFVESPEQAEVLAEELMNRLGAERFTKRSSEITPNIWEDFLRLPS